MLAPRWNSPWVFPAGLLAVVFCLVVATPLRDDVWKRLAHQERQDESDFLLVSREASLKSRGRILFRDVAMIDTEARTVEWVRSSRGRYAVVRKKPAVSTDQVQNELRSLLNDPRVSVGPIPGAMMWRFSVAEWTWGAGLALFGPVALWRTLRRRGERKFWPYGLAGLTGLALAGVALWANLMELFGRATLGWAVGSMAFLGVTSAYLVLCASGVLWWWIHLQGRCRKCLSRLRLPLGAGSTGGVVVDPAQEASVCIYGHGTLTRDRWRIAWREHGSMWEELFGAGRSGQVKP